MKSKCIFFLTILTLISTQDLYAKNDKANKDKSSKSRESKESKGSINSSVKSHDAKKNWGQLKNDFKESQTDLDSDGDFDNFDEKLYKEQIKAEKRIRREVRRSGISDEEIENAVKEYFYDQTIDPNLLDYFSERSLEKMERAVEKYENSEKKVFSKQGIITEEVVE
ncbi:hypothetical protein [uncultured Ilyobacter sp.]|uniref:hypothetical protein n=1 Tax=uncultured Ilyobacter sp. TaxID=544433 RepID=UPI002AA6E40B|nr:hypothetical protein [uncultured Ilyobacter sp.]